jgi:hypothetical protein
MVHQSLREYAMYNRYSRSPLQILTDLSPFKSNSDVFKWSYIYVFS